MPFLQKNLRPTEPIDPTRVQQWIRDLDATQFKVRQNASRELRQLGQRIAPALRKALEGKPSLETRQRLQDLLQAAGTKVIANADQLRTIRAIESLERIATSEANQVLRVIATGAKDAAETVEALDSLERLKERSKLANRQAR